MAYVQRPASSATPTDEDDQWTRELSERAAAALAALDPDTQQRFIDTFDAVVTDEFRAPPEFADPSRGLGDWQSLGVGDYRAIVRFSRQNRTMQAGTVGHRSSIYDEFP